MKTTKTTIPMATSDRQESRYCPLREKTWWNQVISAGSVLRKLDNCERLTEGELSELWEMWRALARLRVAY